MMDSVTLDLVVNQLPRSRIKFRLCPWPTGSANRKVSVAVPSPLLVFDTGLIEAGSDDQVMRSLETSTVSDALALRFLRNVRKR